MQHLAPLAAWHLSLHLPFNGFGPSKVAKPVRLSRQEIYELAPSKNSGIWFYMLNYPVTSIYCTTDCVHQRLFVCVIVASKPDPRLPPTLPARSLSWGTSEGRAAMPTRPPSQETQLGTPSRTRRVHRCTWSSSFSRPPSSSWDPSLSPPISLRSRNLVQVQVHRYVGSSAVELEETPFDCSVRRRKSGLSVILEWLFSMLI